MHPPPTEKASKLCRFASVVAQRHSVYDMSGGFFFSCAQALWLKGDLHFFSGVRMCSIRAAFCFLPALYHWVFLVNFPFGLHCHLLFLRERQHFVTVSLSFHGIYSIKPLWELFISYLVFWSSLVTWGSRVFRSQNIVLLEWFPHDWEMRVLCIEVSLCSDSFSTLLLSHCRRASLSLFSELTNSAWQLLTLCWLKCVSSYTEMAQLFQMNINTFNWKLVNA